MAAPATCLRSGASSRRARASRFRGPSSILLRAPSAIPIPSASLLLYALLWRLRTNRAAMEDRADPLLRRVDRLAKEVRRDIHKMHAFVRFREVEQPDGSTRFIAFFEPEHHIVRHTAGFFVRRFSNMRWSILTPELSIHWDGETLDGRAWRGPRRCARRRSARRDVEDLLRVHLQSRAAEGRRDAQGDAEEILAQHAGDFARSALDRERSRPGTGDDRPSSRAKSGLKNALEAERRVEPGGNLRASWDALIKEARGCTRCDLYKHATQTVFGEGPLDATIMFVGEQPGDQEDFAGRPFVGPAGQVFDEALEKAGIDRSDGLRHQCGQALQVRAARQEAHPQQAGRGRDRGLPLVDRAGALADPPAGHRRARRDRGALDPRQGRDDQPRPRLAATRWRTAANAG